MFATLLLAAPNMMQFAVTCDKPTFLGLVPWYQYLDLAKDPVTNACKITNFDPAKAADGTTVQHVVDGQSPFLLISLAVLDDLIRITALIAVGFVIYGGIQYITSQGSPDSTKRAQQTIINALIGLAIALIAVGIVSFIGNKLGA